MAEQSAMEVSTESGAFKMVETSRQVVKMHPVVLFAILDHFIHRNEGQQRVIGTLLGNKTATGQFVVKNCFPVPHVEQGDEEVAVGKDYLQQMLELHRSVNSGEEVLGWYATTPGQGVLINQQSCLIQDFYSAECGDPLHIVVDTSLANNVLGVKAFMSETVKLGESVLAASFVQLKVELQASEKERIGLDLMIKATKSRFDTSQQLQDSKQINTEVENLEQSMNRLLTMLENVSAYVDDVVAKRKIPDYRTGSKIASVISMVPRIEPAVFEKSFRSNLQDLLMVVYLSNMTRTQLAVAERISKSTMH
mmetsp:Transcript_96/g.323  ORF Transcript_96/g.323 Transcript_96/m.323 type:complete len:308 (-) Transcript_96:60-983(-)|eukprot:CAMPEP_0171528694 /NCGR_PEP_ID=MMETSP0959-20130129/11841_1 /TAXON_ID=87120 /ORGANISM="Aurantiochytrium limacinum, Strain ATCCMYA-1381" /LENGTH=307 /DNA_ID=CAMNT_0012070757 /DNA_START=186 /DNA_END=1109 /DNA_ORIENTATION=+